MNWSENVSLPETAGFSKHPSAGALGALLRVLFPQTKEHVTRRVVR